MSTDPAPYSPSDLMEHASFLQDLAKDLVWGDAEAADLVQETWLKALVRPPGHTGSPKAWLSRVIRHLALNAGRSTRRRVKHEQQTYQAGDVPSAMAVNEFQEQLSVVSNAVKVLPEDLRMVVHLRYYEGHGTQEIARRLETPLGTAKSRLKQALGILRKKLDQNHGGDRRTWCTALVPFVGSPGKVIVGSTVLVSSKGIFGGAIALSAKKIIVVSIFIMLLVFIIDITLSKQNMDGRPYLDGRIVGGTGKEPDSRESSTPENRGATSSGYKEGIRRPTVAIEKRVARITGSVIGGNGLPINRCPVFLFLGPAESVKEDHLGRSIFVEEIRPGITNIRPVRTRYMDRENRLRRLGENPNYRLFSYPVYRWDMTDKTGQYHLTLEKPRLHNDYRLFIGAIAPAGYVQPRPMEVKPPFYEPGKTPMIKLYRAGVIQGMAPLPSGKVYAWQTVDGIVRQEKEVSIRDGCYTMKGLLPGKWRLVALAHILLATNEIRREIIRSPLVNLSEGNLLDVILSEPISTRIHAQISAPKELRSCIRTELIALHGGPPGDGTELDKKFGFIHPPSTEEGDRQGTSAGTYLFKGSYLARAVIGPFSSVPGRANSIFSSLYLLDQKFLVERSGIHIVKIAFDDIPPLFSLNLSAKNKFGQTLKHVDFIIKVMTPGKFQSAELSVSTNSQGIAKLSNLPKFEYTITANKSGYSDSTEKFNWSSQERKARDFVFTLVHFPLVKGHVVDSRGRGIPGLIVWGTNNGVTWPGTEERRRPKSLASLQFQLAVNQSRAFCCKTGQNGEFKTHSLLPGNWHIEVRNPSFKKEIKQIKLENDEMKEIQFESR